MNSRRARAPEACTCCRQTTPSEWHTLEQAMLEQLQQALSRAPPCPAQALAPGPDRAASLRGAPARLEAPLRCLTSPKRMCFVVHHQCSAYPSLQFSFGIWTLNFLLLMSLSGRSSHRRRLHLVALCRLDQFSTPHANPEAPTFLSHALDHAILYSTISCGTSYLI